MVKGKGLRYLSAAAAAVILMVLQGCVSAPHVTVKPNFKPPADIEIVYVVPFTSILVPDDFKVTAFNDLVDILNESRTGMRVQQFEIIKGEMNDQDPEWLARQFYISGEFWSYIENAGCCSTELRVRARAALTEPGKHTPSMEITLPLEGFFEHDRSTLEKEKNLLAKRLASDLADRIIASISGKR